MSSKRVNCDLSAECYLMNATTGDKYDISPNDEFVIGRSLDSTLLIEEIYISRRQCIIYYKNGKFFIRDNSTICGTFLNCNKLSKGIDHPEPLLHGDLLSFGNETKMEYIFKFCFIQSQKKKPKLEKCIKKGKQNSSDIDKDDKDLKESLVALHSEIQNIKVEKLAITYQTQVQFSEIQKIIDNAMECVKKLSIEAVKQNNVIQDLNNKINEYRTKLMIQQECLDSKTIEKELSVDLFITKLNDILENDFQCPICNEVMIKVHSAQCTHAFCETCIIKWLKRKNICPVCRAPVLSTNKCLAADNFIKSLYELIGGNLKEQREILLNERKPPTQTARRGRRTNVRRNINNPYRSYDLLRPFNGLLNFAGPIEIVDLTTGSPSTSRRDR